MIKEIECKGCSCVWEIENTQYKNQLEGTLKQCPMCWDGRKRE